MATVKLDCHRCGVTIAEEAHGYVTDRVGNPICLNDAACATRILAGTIQHVAARMAPNVRQIAPREE
jgi:hypothetical protein